MKRNIALARASRKSRIKNHSSSYEQAKAMSEKFHGRDVEQVLDVLESYSEPVNLAQLGYLEELVVNPLHSKYEYPINFEEYKDDKDIIKLACNGKGEQIYFVGGNQNIDEIVETIHKDSDSHLNLEHRQYIVLGHCISIAYFADKHHLTGPKSQKDGISYEHQFGEENGYPPLLVYDKLNKRLMLLGGTYHVEDRGIVN